MAPFVLRKWAAEATRVTVSSAVSSSIARQRREVTRPRESNAEA